MSDFIIKDFREFMQVEFGGQIIWRMPDLTKDPPDCFMQLHKWAKQLRKIRRRKHVYADHIEKRILFHGRKPRNFILGVEHAELGTIYPSTTKYLKNLVNYEEEKKKHRNQGLRTEKLKDKLKKDNFLFIPIIIEDIVNGRKFILTGNIIIAYLTQIKRKPVPVLTIKYNLHEGKVYNGTPFY